MRNVSHQSHKQRKRDPSTAAQWITQLKRWLVGMARLCTPAARGVYHPQADSQIVLGAAVPTTADLDELEQQLWWRGLGIVKLNGQLVAGADVTVAAQQRRLKRARIFVTRQLRDAGVRGPVKRWQK